MKSSLSDIDTWLKTRFDTVLENLNTFHVWYFLTHVLEPNFQKPRMRITEWYPRFLRGINMVIVNIHSTQVGLVLNIVNGSMLLQFHVLFDGMFHTVVIITSTGSYMWIRLVVSIK